MRVEGAGVPIRTEEEQSRPEPAKGAGRRLAVRACDLPQDHETLSSAADPVLMADDTEQSGGDNVVSGDEPG